MKKALTIAGSDTSGGAGIQADLKTFQELGVYGMTALTVIVAMDPHNNWGHQVFPVDTDILKAQIETAVVGIGADAMKTGMLPTTDIIEIAAHTVKKHGLKNVVVDPVMVCKGANEAIHPENAVCYAETLVPLASVVTPNLFEASQLTGKKAIETLDDMKDAAQRIYDMGAKCVVVKGGKAQMGDRSDEQSLASEAYDVVYDGKVFRLLKAERIDTNYTHGAGCTFSAAITAELAKGASVEKALDTAKAFITAALKHSFPLNRYVGPTNHGAYRNSL